MKKRIRIRMAYHPFRIILRIFTAFHSSCTKFFRFIVYSLIQLDMLSFFLNVCNLKFN